MNRLGAIFCSVLVMLLCSCNHEIADVGDGMDGALRICLSDISCGVSIDSKATPSQLDIPVAEQFNLKVVRNSNGAVIFDNVYQAGMKPVKVASNTDYTITAEYGSNPVLALNAPYYVGSVIESVEYKQTKDITIPCSVGNSLISVKFGSTEADSLRFARYFENYALIVAVDNNRVSLPCSNSNVSAYLRAGSAYALHFEGMLAATGELRSFELSSDKLPSSLDAAEHLVVTLDIQSDMGVDVTVKKAEIENSRIEQTIPYEWLPMPSVTAEHRFSADGTLMGTDLSFTESYPGCEWTVHVKNASGVEVRTVHGKGSLESSYTESAAWPYLPSGMYTATFSYDCGGSTVAVSGRQRNFAVSSPSSLKLAFTEGYSSYDKYASGDISAANACNPSTIYSPAVELGLSSSIADNANYSSLARKYTESVDGTAVKTVTSSTGSSCSFPDITGKTARTSVYVCAVTAEFDGCTASASKPFYITGLPYRAQPPSSSEWSVVQGGNKVSFKGSYLAIADGGTTTADPTVQSPSFHCPEGSVALNVRVSSTGTAYSRKVLITYNVEANFYQGGDKIHTITSSKAKDAGGNPYNYSADRQLTEGANYFRIDAKERTELSGFIYVNTFDVLYR